MTDGGGQLPGFPRHRVARVLRRDGGCGLQPEVKVEAAFLQLAEDGRPTRQVFLGITRAELVLVKQDIQRTHRPLPMSGDPELCDLMIEQVLPLAVIKFFVINDKSKLFTVCTCYGNMLYFEKCRLDSNVEKSWETWIRVVKEISVDRGSSYGPALWRSSTVLDMKSYKAALENSLLKSGSEEKGLILYVHTPPLSEHACSVGVQAGGQPAVEGGQAKTGYDLIVSNSNSPDVINPLGGRPSARLRTLTCQHTMTALSAVDHSGQTVMPTRSCSWTDTGDVRRIRGTTADTLKILKRPESRNRDSLEEILDIDGESDTEDNVEAFLHELETTKTNTGRDGFSLWQKARRLVMKKPARGDNFQQVVFKTMAASGMPRSMNGLDPREASLALTAISKRLLMSLRPADIQQYSATKGRKLPQRLAAVLECGQSISKMVASEILRYKSVLDRTNVIKRFLEICTELLFHQHDFQSLAMVLVGLTSLPIYRLDSTWVTLFVDDPLAFRTFIGIVKILSPKGHYMAYTERIRRLRVKGIPFLPWLDHFLQHCKNSRFYIANYKSNGSGDIKRKPKPRLSKWQMIRILSRLKTVGKAGPKGKLPLYKNQAKPQEKDAVLSLIRTDLEDELPQSKNKAKPMGNGVIVSLIQTDSKDKLSEDKSTSKLPENEAAMGLRRSDSKDKQSQNKGDSKPSENEAGMGLIKTGSKDILPQNKRKRNNTKQPENGGETGLINTGSKDKLPLEKNKTKPPENGGEMGMIKTGSKDKLPHDKNKTKPPKNGTGVNLMTPDQSITASDGQMISFDHKLPTRTISKQKSILKKKPVNAIPTVLCLLRRKKRKTVHFTDDVDFDYRGEAGKMKHLAKTRLSPGDKLGLVSASDENISDTFQSQSGVKTRSVESVDPETLEVIKRYSAAKTQEILTSALLDMSAHLSSSDSSDESEASEETGSEGESESSEGISADEDESFTPMAAFTTNSNTRANEDNTFAANNGSNKMFEHNAHRVSMRGSTAVRNDRAVYQPLGVDGVGGLRRSSYVPAVIQGPRRKSLFEEVARESDIRSEDSIHLFEEMKTQRLDKLKKRGSIALALFNEEEKDTNTTKTNGQRDFGSVLAGNLLAGFRKSNKNTNDNSNSKKSARKNNKFRHRNNSRTDPDGRKNKREGKSHRISPGNDATINKVGGRAHIGQGRLTRRLSIEAMFSASDRCTLCAVSKCIYVSDKRKQLLQFKADALKIRPRAKKSVQNYIQNAMKVNCLLAEYDILQISLPLD